MFVRHPPTGAHLQGVSTVGAHWSRFCVLLRLDFGHTVYGDVVPSFWHPIAYIGLNRIEFLQKEIRGPYARSTDRQGN